MASNSRSRRTNTQQIDYYQLNGGCEDNVPFDDRCSDFPALFTNFVYEHDNFDQILLSESISQRVSQVQPPQEQYKSTLPDQEQSELITQRQERSESTLQEEPNPSECTISSSFQPPSKRKKTINHWIWEHFKTTVIDYEWKARRSGKMMKQNTIIECIQYKWKTRDSTRYGSIDNIIYYIRSRHNITTNTTDSKQPTLTSMVKNKEILSAKD